jgi:hypothetical protein
MNRSVNEKYENRADFMKRFVKYIGVLGLLAAFFCACPVSIEAMEEEPLPAEVLSGAEHLLSLVGSGNGETFHPERIAGLMDFVTRPKKDGVRFAAQPDTGSSSSYNEVDVRIRLADLLRYSFNPSIPWFVTTPSSLRITAWKQTDKTWPELPRLWELLDDTADAPVVIRGMETVENTPDLFSGAYYRYDLHRALVLFSNGPRRTVISISKQVDVSDVGRKGYIVGKDEDWTYFYSGEPGLTVTGLGWVKSYLFDSTGISVYTEAGQGQPLVRTANFKWIRGGWSNINMVRNEHIFHGMARFAQAFKEVLESPRLPSAKDLEVACRRIAKLTHSELLDKMETYRRLLAARGDKLSGGARESLPAVFWEDSYWKQMGRKEMEAALVLETLKAFLGKVPEAEVDDLVLLPSPKPPQQGG